MGSVGFEVPVTEYDIPFQDERLQGAEIRCRRLTVREYLEFSDIVHIADDRIQVDVAGMRRLSRMFPSKLVSWNLEKEGVPLSADEDGVNELESSFLTLIVREWTLWVGGVAIPLEKPSGGGESLREDSIPMEDLSESPSLSPEPNPSSPSSEPILDTHTPV